VCQPLLKLEGNIGQALAVAVIGKIGLHMADDPLGRINRQATVVVEFAGLTEMRASGSVGL